MKRIVIWSVHFYVGFFTLLALSFFGSGCQSGSKKAKRTEAVASSTGRANQNGGLSKGGVESPDSGSMDSSKEVGDETSEPLTKGEPSRPTWSLDGEVKKLSDSIKAKESDERLRTLASGILSHNPNEVRALNVMAIYYMRRKKYLAAQYFLEKALKVDGNSPALHNNMGLTSIALKNTSEGIQDLHRALELDEGDGVVSSNLGSIYLESKNFVKGLMALEGGKSRVRRDYRWYNNMGVATAASGDFDQAQGLYDEGLKLNATSKELLFNSSILKIDRLKKFKEGLDQIRRLRFVGFPPSMKNKIIELEKKCQAGVK